MGACNIRDNNGIKMHDENAIKCGTCDCFYAGVCQGCNIFISLFLQYLYLYVRYHDKQCPPCRAVGTEHIQINVRDLYKRVHTNASESAFVVLTSECAASCHAGMCEIRSLWWQWSVFKNCQIVVHTDVPFGVACLSVLRLALFDRVFLICVV